MIWFTTRFGRHYGIGRNMKENAHERTRSKLLEAQLLRIEKIKVYSVYLKKPHDYHIRSRTVPRLADP